MNLNKNIRRQMIYDYVLEHEGKKFGFKEIGRYIFGSREISDNYDNRERMFYRDLEYMKDDLGVDIQWDEKIGGYVIAHKKTSGISEKLFEAYHFLQLFEHKENFSKFIVFEKRVVSGNYLFNEILKAVKGRELTEVKYYNYLHHTSETFTFYPYYLKESKNRWYAIGVKFGKDEILALGLDRINDFKIIPKHTRPDFDPKYSDENYYADVMGAYNSPSMKVEKIELEFSRFQAAYIKAYPIHDSQKHKDYEDRTVIKLEMKITPDFLMELMQYGNKIKVIAPEKLRTHLLKMHVDAIRVLNSENNNHLVEEEFLIK